MFCWESVFLESVLVKFGMIDVLVLEIGIGVMFCFKFSVVGW